MRPYLLSFFFSPIQPVFLVSSLLCHSTDLLRGDALDFRLDFKVISYSFSFASHTSFYLCMPICLSIMSMTSPLFFLVEDIGFEPMTPCVQGRCSSQLS